MMNIQSVDSLLEFIEKGGHPQYLFFWGHKQKKNVVDKACLSQWFPATFNAQGSQYSSAEQFMMAAKAKLFEDDESLAKILATQDPGKAKALGRKVKNFEQSKWQAHCFAIVVEANVYKFSQNQAMKAFLLATGDKVLVEASPRDKIWGIGLAEKDPRCTNPHLWCGQNLLGFALMAARQKILDEQ